MDVFNKIKTSWPRLKVGSLWLVMAETNIKGAATIEVMLKGQSGYKVVLMAITVIK